MRQQKVDGHCLSFKVFPYIPCSFLPSHLYSHYLFYTCSPSGLPFHTVRNYLSLHGCAWHSSRSIHIVSLTSNFSYSSLNYKYSSEIPPQPESTKILPQVEWALKIQSYKMQVVYPWEVAKTVFFSWSVLSQGAKHRRTTWSYICHSLTDSPHRKIRSLLITVWEWELARHGSQPSFKIFTYPWLQWYFLGAHNQGVSVNIEGLAGSYAIKILCLNQLPQGPIRVAPILGVMLLFSPSLTFKP